MDRRPSPHHLLFAAMALLAGCSVGPNYVRPDAPMTASDQELGGEWGAALPRDDVLRSAWWGLYDDPVLSDLVTEVAAANQNLAAADARYRQARTLVLQARSNWYPTATFGVSFARSR